MLKKPYLRSKICNINFWIGNDPPPFWNFSENSSVLETPSFPNSCICLQEHNVVETRVAEPNPGDFGGRRIVAVVTSEAHHWVTYIVSNQLWYRVDSAGGGSVRQSNPFHDQSARRTLCFLAFT